MENNKILIEVEFHGKTQSQGTCIELFVLRDMKMRRLLEGIQYGIAKLAETEGPYQTLYKKCADILKSCHGSVKQASDGRKYYDHITFTSFNDVLANRSAHGGNRYVFYREDFDKPICDIGFITSTRVVFDESGFYEPAGKLDTDHIIEAFDPKRSNEIFFPEYNISTRQIYRFNTEPVNIISPSDPPQPPEARLLDMLLPLLITLILMSVVRGASSMMMGGGLIMVAITAAMGLGSIITAIFTFNRQKKHYFSEKEQWKERYTSYLDDLIESIKTRKQNDAKTLDLLYPDPLTIVEKNDFGAYSLNSQMYSRAPQDGDFLTFRIGKSDDVPTMFEIQSNEEESIFSEADAAILKSSDGKEHLHIYLRSDEEAEKKKKKNTAPADPKPRRTVNLSEIPGAVSRHYSRMNDAPLLYSLKNKGALGVVDKNINSVFSRSSYFIRRMIFELCYYHSPETLQFIIFFPHERNFGEMELHLAGIKCMPHFRGLFDDKSQFVFNAESANMVLSHMMTIMNQRAEKTEDEEEKDVEHPHIVFIVFDDFDMKEHAFAEYLPKAPRDGEEYQNKLGLSFVFVKKFKEYLPEYCDDVIDFDRSPMLLTPRNNQMGVQRFIYPVLDSQTDRNKFITQYFTKNVFAERFMSAVYYAKIAENGKVPSSASLYDLFPGQNPDSIDFIIRNWGFGPDRKRSNITETLSVPVGITESEITYLDLHEKADGPHMLVAGTTGSGKTETIITFLLGLCMKYRPDELNLLLVDMKGGGFTKRIGQLPHVVGSVTDVDGDENGTGSEYMLRRFLNAMSAEIKRRKILFNTMRVDSIDAFIEASRDIEAHIEKKQIPESDVNEVRRIAKKEKLSHLILVVDEFTELKRFTTENNDIDFIGEITTIARIGRSLGFHIILISQNIEGAITDDIRVNSKSRLCLKVATRQASKDMLGTEVAAAPSMPGNGRAYLLVGTGSKFEYFQSGYSGASAIEDTSVEIILAEKTGAYRTFYKSSRDNRRLIEKINQLKRTGQLKTQLDETVANIQMAYLKHQTQMNEPHIIFRTPLPRCIMYDRSTDKAVEVDPNGGRFA